MTIASLNALSAPTPNSISPLGAVGASAKTPLNAMAEDFETVFLSSMFGQMTSLLSGDGPLGGEGAGGDAWRAMLTDELAKSVSRSGGVGIARSVHAELLALQSAETSNHDRHNESDTPSEEPAYPVPSAIRSGRGGFVPYGGGAA